MMRRLSALLLACVATAACASDYLKTLPPMSTIIEGYENVDSVAARLAALPLCPAEGIWQMTGGGALFAIERENMATELAPTRLRMVMVRSPWRTIRPGTLLGHLEPTVRPGVYEARIYSTIARRTGRSVARAFTLKLDDERSLMTFEPFKSPVRINVFRLLPYMYRRLVEVQKSRPDGLDGAVRVMPASESNPLTAVYL